MRTVHWNEGLQWGDPNLRWGEPAYLLEPGDAGYVAPPGSEPKTKRKKMRRNPYYPDRQSDQIVWLTNFGNKLPDEASALSLSSGTVNVAVADAKWLVYVKQLWLPAVRSWALAATDAVTEAETGSGSSAQVLPTFTAPALPAGVVAVNPGALNRIFALVQQIKDSGKATETIRSNLGIIGSERSGPDLTTVQPQISAGVSGNRVEIKWGWGGNGDFLDMCEIQVDRGDGQGFRVLTFDTTPNYTDTQAFPGSPARWTYRAIYRVADAQVGQWSAPVAVNVG